MTETTLQERLRATTQEMASACSVPMDLWNRHSNAVLEAADALTDAQAEVERLRALADERFAEIKRAQGIINDLKAFRERVLTKEQP